MKTVKMVQITYNLWQIVGPKGNVIKKDIVAHGIDQANDYARRYVSSFPNWEYIIVLRENKS